MHTNLDLLYSAKDGGEISAPECKIIVRELSKLNSALIPGEQIQNVRDFLNQQLLHRQVEDEFVAAIEILLAELENRT